MKYQTGVLAPIFYPGLNYGNEKNMTAKTLKTQHYLLQKKTDDNF